MSATDTDTFDPLSVDWEAVASVAGASEVEPDEIEALPVWDPRRTPVTPEEDEAYAFHHYGPDDLHDEGFEYPYQGEPL